MDLENQQGSLNKNESIPTTPQGIRVGCISKNPLVDANGSRFFTVITPPKFRYHEMMVWKMYLLSIMAIWDIFS